MRKVICDGCTERISGALTSKDLAQDTVRFLSSFLGSVGHSELEQTHS